MDRKPASATSPATSREITPGQSASEASEEIGETRSTGFGPQSQAALESLVAYLTVLLIGLLTAATAPI